MVFAVTARHSAGPTQTAAQTQTSNSRTFTADSLALVFWGSQRENHTTAEVFQTPTGGGWTYTQRQITAAVPWESTFSFAGRSAFYSAPVSSSPSAHTITVDSWSGSNLGAYTTLVCDITGHDSIDPIVQTVAAAAAINPSQNNQSRSIVLGSTPAVGSLVVVAFWSGADEGGGFAAPTIGGQAMQQLFNQNGPWLQAGLWAREITGAESNNTITCSDLGDDVGQWLAIAVEIAADTGGDQELDVPFLDSGSQLFAITVENQAAQELAVPHHSQTNSIFPITVQNQNAQELNANFIPSEVQIFVPAVENQSAQELNVPHHPSEVQIFVPTLTTGDHELDVPFLENVNTFFLPTVEDQSEQELNVSFIDSTAQLFAVTVENQSDEELDVSFLQNVALLFTPTVFNEGEELFEPTLVGNGTLADRIMAGLIDQGFLTGTIVDREYARLLAKLSLSAPQPKSLDDLYSMADEDNRILNIGIDSLGAIA